MGDRSNRIIDTLIDKKIHSGSITSCSREQLFDFPKTQTNPGQRMASIIKDRAFDAEKDLYNNKIYNFMKSNLKSESRINILNLFKPGEILNSVIHNR